MVAASVSIPHSADFTIAPVLGVYPFHGIVAIGGFFGKGIPLTLGCELAADILESAHLTTSGEVIWDSRLTGRRFVIGCSFEE